MAGTELVSDGGGVCLRGAESAGGLALDGITIPPPVFFCSVEPASAAVQSGNGEMSSVSRPAIFLSVYRS